MIVHWCDREGVLHAPIATLHGVPNVRPPLSSCPRPGEHHTTPSTHHACILPCQGSLALAGEYTLPTQARTTPSLPILHPPCRTTYQACVARHCCTTPVVPYTLPQQGSVTTPILPHPPDRSRSHRRTPTQASLTAHSRHTRGWWLALVAQARQAQRSTRACSPVTQ
jgi:hypothetical protein